MPSLYPQGTFSYSGGIPAASVLRCTVRHSHGLNPDRIYVQMVMPIDGSLPEKNGDVTLTYGTTEIVLKGCTIDYMDRPDGAALVLDLNILDRRWRWPTAVIGGLYNQRWKNGTELRAETKKKPSELAILLLKALGETKYDVSALKAVDGKDFPIMNWDVTPAANALQELCERYSYRAIYDWFDDMVHIVKLGTGAELAINNLVLSNSQTYNPPELPGELVCLGAPTSVQADWALYPVGVDSDGQIKPINKVVYAPGSPTFLQGVDLEPAEKAKYLKNITGFWNTLPSLNLFGLPTPLLRHWAEENIYRLYRIQPPATLPNLDEARGGLSGPKLDDFPNVEQNNSSTNSWLWRIELQSEQNDRVSSQANPLATQFNEYNKEVGSSALPAWVYGQFCASTYGITNVLKDDVDQKGNITKLGILKLDPSTKGVVSPEVLQVSTVPGNLSPFSVTNRVLESGFYLGGFEINPEWALVKFAEPVFQIQRPKSAGIIDTWADGTKMPQGVVNCPPTLWLRTRCLLREPDTRAYVRPGLSLILDKNNPVTRTIVREDLVLKLTYRYKGPPKITAQPVPQMPIDKLETNWDVIKPAMKFYLDQIKEEYQTLQPQGVVYAGFLPLRLDGAIRAITWDIDFAGYTKTRVSRDTEHLVWHQSYSEKRMIERMRAAQKQTQDPAPPPGQPKKVF